MKLGKKYEATKKDRKKYSSKFIGPIIEEYNDFYVMQTRNYKTCIDKAGIIANEYEIKAI